MASSDHERFIFHSALHDWLLFSEIAVWIKQKNNIWTNCWKYHDHKWLLTASYRCLENVFFFCIGTNAQVDSQHIYIAAKWATLVTITLSFLSCRAYGKQGITAVTRDADAILHALIMMRSSIIMSFTSPQPLCMMNTSSPRTDSPISTLQQNKHHIYYGA